MFSTSRSSRTRHSCLWKVEALRALLAAPLARGHLAHWLVLDLEDPRAVREAVRPLDVVGDGVEALPDEEDPVDQRARDRQQALLLVRPERVQGLGDAQLLDVEGDAAPGRHAVEVDDVLPREPRHGAVRAAPHVRHPVARVDLVGSIVVCRHTCWIVAFQRPIIASSPFLTKLSQSPCRSKHMLAADVPQVLHVLLEDLAGDVARRAQARLAVLGPRDALRLSMYSQSSAVVEPLAGVGEHPGLTRCGMAM